MDSITAMDSATRANARAIIGEISSHDVETMYHVRSGTLFVTIPGKKLNTEQRELVAANKMLLVEFLTTPPEQEGQCIRGHAVRWKLTDYGGWMCGCYFEEHEVQPAPTPEVNNSLRDVWMRDTKKDGGNAMPPSISKKAGQIMSSRTNNHFHSQCTPGAQEPERQHQAASKETRIIYADINAGRAISLSGDTLPFTANCSLPELARQIVNDQDTRVFLCGELPVDYEAWLIDPAIYAGYTTGKKGHYLDPKDHTGHVARFEHRTTGSKLEIRSMSAWLGDSAYTVEQARDAVLLLNQYLQRSFTTDTIAYSTPSQTFQQIWTRQNRMEKKAYPLLPQEIRDIIHSTSGQGRVELLTQEQIKKLTELHYYDGVFMYAALTWGLPTELESHDHENVYAGKVPARYRIRYTVPGNWQHIGLFMTPKGNETWFYPGEKCQGQTFETWADGAEIAALIDHYSPAPEYRENATKEQIRDEKERAYRAGMLAAFSAWKIEILERIVFKSEKDSEHKKPLDTITKKLVTMREQVEKDARLDTSRSAVYKLVRGMVRNIALHGIGAFHRNERDMTIILPKDAPAPDNILAAPKELGDNLYIYSVPGKIDTYSEQFDHPEYSALVWARCRARMTKWALSLPRESLIAIRTDAIATTQEVGAWRASEKVGTLREKWTIRKQLKAPHSYEELDTLVEKHVKEGR